MILGGGVILSARFILLLLLSDDGLEWPNRLVICNFGLEVVVEVVVELALNGIIGVFVVVVVVVVDCDEDVLFGVVELESSSFLASSLSK